MPAHAWIRRTAEVVLRGSGFIVQVAERTAHHFDMAGFQVWLKTADPSKIPRRRALFIPEPVGAHLRRYSGRSRHSVVSSRHQAPRASGQDNIQCGSRAAAAAAIAFAAFGAVGGGREGSW